MDEMNISLKTSFMRGLVTKIIEKVIFQKTGHHVNVRLNGIRITHASSCDVNLHVDMDIGMAETELMNTIKDVMKLD